MEGSHSIQNAALVALRLINHTGLHEASFHAATLIELRLQRLPLAVVEPRLDPPDGELRQPVQHQVIVVPAEDVQRLSLLDQQLEQRVVLLASQRDRVADRDQLGLVQLHGLANFYIHVKAGDGCDDGARLGDFGADFHNCAGLPTDGGTF